MPRTGQELLSQYAEAIALKLSRPLSVLQQHGLQAGDFKDTLDFEFDDRSHATFRYAFFIHDQQARALAVFTEHCGYFLFPDHVRIKNAGGVLIFDGLSGLQ